MAEKIAVKVPPERWLILVHQLPARPAYHRVKIWRRLQDEGAVALKNALYLLPANPLSRSAFAGILREIEKAGGEGAVYAAELAGGMRDDQLRGLFNAARDADYQRIVTELRELSKKWKKLKTPKDDTVAVLRRIASRLAALGRIDFFGAGGRVAAEALLAELEHSAIVIQKTGQKGRSLGPADMIAKTWVTRRDIHVDRIACAWLIRRFIDPQAVFKFVAVRQYRAAPGEYRFDMREGEFTHEGDRCSFEVLLSRALIKDPALAAIGEIVHDIDLKDGKFGRPETAGVAHVISGICRTQGEDEARLRRGSELFDDIYEQFRRLRS